MNTNRVLVALAAIAVAAGCQNLKFNKVEPDAAQKAVAEKFGTETLTAWAQDRYPKTGIPADPRFKEGQDDEARQKAAAKSIAAQIGTFQSMTFVEALVSDPPKVVVYRFKGKFSKSDAPAEVRVVFDTEGKLSGFWIKPWKDVMG